MKHKNLHCFYHKHSYKKKTGKISISAITTVALLNVASICAYASGSGGNVLERANSASALQTLYDFMLAISVPMAAVGITMCAFSFFLPGEKGWEIARKRILHIGIALAAFFLIPAVMRFATHTSANNGWKAEGGNPQIIENQSDVFDIKSDPAGDPASDPPSE